MAPFPPFFRVLSTPRDRPTNIRASEPSSRLSVRGLIRFFFSFFFFNQHRVRLDRRHIVSFAPSLALRLGTLARSRSGTWPHHTHTHTLSLSLSLPDPQTHPLELTGRATIYLTMVLRYKADVPFGHLILTLAACMSTCVHAN